MSPLVNRWVEAILSQRQRLFHAVIRACDVQFSDSDTHERPLHRELLQ